jgi:hypothetical protein
MQFLAKFRRTGPPSVLSGFAGFERLSGEWKDADADAKMEHVHVREF